MTLYLITLAGVIILALILMRNRRTAIVIIEPFDWTQKWQLAKSTLPDESKKLVNAFTAAALNPEEPLDKILTQFKKQTQSSIILENKIAPLTIQRIFDFKGRIYSLIIGLIDDCRQDIKYYKSKDTPFDKKCFAKLQQEEQASNSNGFLALAVFFAVLHKSDDVNRNFAHTYIGSLIMEPIIKKDGESNIYSNKQDKLRILSILPAKLIEWFIKETPLQDESVIDWRILRSLPFVRQDEQIKDSIIIASADEEALYRVKKEWQAL